MDHFTLNKEQGRLGEVAAMREAARRSDWKVTALGWIGTRA
ncbi:hypothetical protein [Streptomyces sp. CB02400]|nr:hypothetical protein [Streptomyces sp. CB02400]